MGLGGQPSICLQLQAASTPLHWQAGGLGLWHACSTVLQSQASSTGLQRQAPSNGRSWHAVDLCLRWRSPCVGQHRHAASLRLRGLRPHGRLHWQAGSLGMCLRPQRHGLAASIAPLQLGPPRLHAVSSLLRRQLGRCGLQVPQGCLLHPLAPEEVRAPAVQHRNVVRCCLFCGS